MSKFALPIATCMALGIQPHANYGELQHGQICLANDSLFSQATYQTELSAQGIGYADPNRNRLAQLLQFIAPKRTGPRNATLTVYDETEPFETVDYKAVKREMLGDFPLVKQRKSTKVTRKTVNRGLTIVLDKDQLKEKPNWQNMHVEWLLDLLYRASIMEALALLHAAAASAPAIWDALSDPDMDIQSTNVLVLAKATGFKANRALYGEEATLQRQIAYRPQNNAGGNASAQQLTDQQMAVATGLNRVLTNAERYNNDGNKDTFLGSKVLLFSAQDAESPEDSSNLVRHVSNTDMGGEYATYVDDRPLKKVFLTVENYETFGLQHTSGLAELLVSGS